MSLYVHILCARDQVLHEGQPFRYGSAQGGDRLHREDDLRKSPAMGTLRIADANYGMYERMSNFPNISERLK